MGQGRRAPKEACELHVGPENPGEAQETSLLVEFSQHFCKFKLVTKGKIKCVRVCIS